MTKKERYSKILRLVELKFNHGCASDWKNKEYEKLSFDILVKTKTNISILTLKRIFGKINTTEDYFPQKATIDALELYADVDVSTFGNEVLDIELNANNQKKKFINNSKHTKYIIFICIIIIGILAFYIQLVPTDENNNITRKANFEVVGEDGLNPKTVHFKYTTPNDKDSFSIIFNDEYPPVPVQNGQNETISYFFQQPGIYRARMTKNYNAVSNTVNVFVESNGWQVLGYYFDQKYSERVFPIDIKSSINNDYYHITKPKLWAASIDTLRTVVMRYNNFKKTNVNGDKFSLKASLKNPEKWAAIRCNSIFLNIEGTKSCIRFRFANPGCSHWIEYQLSEKYITSKKHNLSDFTFDINDWQDFRIENHDKTVEVFINDTKRFQGSYQNSIGEIMGVSIMFHGNGYIKNFLLSANETELFKLEP